MLQMSILKNKSLDKDVRWSWATRLIDDSEFYIEKAPLSKPLPGDLGLFRVKEIGYHQNIVTKDDKKLRLYENDFFVGVFGNRYATDGFEGRVGKLDKISMLTAAGMVGTVRYKHRSMKKSTKLVFQGLLIDKQGNRINLKELFFHESTSKPAPNFFACSRAWSIISGISLNSGGCVRTISNPKRGICKISDCGTDIGF